MIAKRMQYKNDDDDVLIEQILSGQKIAEDNLYRKYYVALKEKIAPGLFNEEDVDDIIQDTMIVTLYNIKNGRYIHNGNLPSYIFSISWNLRNKFLKQLKYHSPINDETNLISIKNNSESIEVISDERCSVIIQALNKLDTICDELLSYSFFEGLKPAKIIGLMPELGSTEQISKKRNKCIEKLKRRINKLLNNEK